MYINIGLTTFSFPVLCLFTVTQYQLVKKVDSTLGLLIVHKPKLVWGKGQQERLVGREPQELATQQAG